MELQPVSVYTVQILPTDDSDLPSIPLILLILFPILLYINYSSKWHGFRCYSTIITMDERAFISQ